MVALFNGMQSSLSMVYDREMGVMRLLLTAPLPRGWLLAFKLLKPGGLLFTFSCTGGVSADLFQKIIAGAALDAGVDARIERWLHAAADHPVALNFPEGEYLKGLLCRV